MSLAAVALDSPAPILEPSAAPRLQRATGLLRLGFKRRGPATVLETLYQQGCAKARLPRAEPGRLPEAVLINSAGGLTDGDRLTQEVAWAAGARALATSQAAERIYRSRGQAAAVETRLRVAPEAVGFWLPQETILFDGGRLTRRSEADLIGSARLLAVESLVFGRTAMGEVVRAGALQDHWRVRLDGRLVFADGLRLAGDLQGRLDRPAVAGGARALASIILVGQDLDLDQPALRGLIADLPVTGGCSALGPVLLLRLLADDGAALRAGLIPLLTFLGGALLDGTPSRTFALPRTWSL